MRETSTEKLSIEDWEELVGALIDAESALFHLSATFDELGDDLALEANEIRRKVSNWRRFYERLEGSEHIEEEE